MIRRAPRAAALGLGLLAGGTVALGACSGGSDGADRSDVTIPSSLSVTTTEPGAAPPTTAVTPTTHTTEVPATAPAPEGAPVLGFVAAEPGACLTGTTAVVVSYEVAPEPPVRVVTVVLDGATAGASSTSAPITVDQVACDGAVHSLLVIATGTDGRSSTQSVAFRAPRA